MKNGGGMWRVYKVESYLDAVTGIVLDTLANHCEKGIRIVRPMKNMAFSFRVSEKKSRDGPVVRAEGVLGKCNFIFRSDGSGAAFSENYYKDVEDTFRQFVVMIDFLRRDMGLEQIDFDSLCEIVEADSPPVAADNYVPFEGADTKALQDILSEKFTALAHREFSGKYSIIVYSENARTTGYFCEKNTPVYQKFLGAFKELYGFKDALLVCARSGQEQHVYFYARDKGIFCNREDASRAFLEKQSGFLAELLKNTVRGAMKQQQTTL
jgi:hypothetical protein